MLHLFDIGLFLNVFFVRKIFPRTKKKVRWGKAMRVLDLFSGTGSIKKIALAHGHECLSLDLENADINIDIMKWDYTAYSGFDYIHASPPCVTFSHCRKCHFGKKIKAHPVIFTRALYIQDQVDFGVPLLHRTLEIIDYFKPQFWTIENPQTGDMKKYIDLPYTDVDYCRYGTPYKKPTRIWNNFDFKGLRCEKKCDSMIDNKHKSRSCHTSNAGTTRKGLLRTKKPTLRQMQAIPAPLVESIFMAFQC